VRTNLARPRPQIDEAAHSEISELFWAGHDGDAIGTLMRACRWERTPLARALEEWAHAATVTVIIGDKAMFSMNACDLMDGPALGPARRPIGPVDKDLLPWRKEIAVPIIIPVRQSFSVLITSPVSPSHALRNLASEAGVLPEPLVWVHLEGVLSRSVQ